MAAAIWLALTSVRTLVPEEVALAAVLAIAIVTVLAEMDRVTIPRQPRQVPQSWYATHGAIRSYALYGLWLGAALATNVTYAVEYLVFLGAGLLLPLPEALATGAAFGFGRTALVGPLGFVPRATALLSRIYRGKQQPLPAISVLLSVGLAAGLVVSYLSN